MNQKDVNKATVSPVRDKLFYILVSHPLIDFLKKKLLG